MATKAIATRSSQNKRFCRIRVMRIVLSSGVANQPGKQVIDEGSKMFSNGPDVEGGDGAGEDVHGVVGAEENDGGDFEEGDEQAEGDADSVEGFGEDAGA